MTEEAPVEPSHIVEAKRAAARTGLISVVVILGIITVGIALIALRDFSRPGPVGASLWVSIAAMIVSWAQLLRIRKRLLKDRP